MINDFLFNVVSVLNDIYVNFGISEILSNFITVFSKYQDYTTQIQYYLSGAYYVFGKSLVTFVFTASGLVFVFRFVMAVIYIVGNYVP